MWTYLATVERVVDGDTLDLDIDLGFKSHKRVRCRLLGVDTPETYGVKKISEEFRKGMAAKSFVVDWLLDHGERDDTRNPSAARIVVRTHKGGATGKYGRWLVEVYPIKTSAEWSSGTTAEGETLNDALIRNGHAELYDGGKR
jgi:micrococcal nuclease